jgi:hypothetical protein
MRHEVPRRDEDRPSHRSPEENLPEIAPASQEADGLLPRTEWGWSSWNEREANWARIVAAAGPAPSKIPSGTRPDGARSASSEFRDEDPVVDRNGRAPNLQVEALRTHRARSRGARRPG